MRNEFHPLGAIRVYRYSSVLVGDLTTKESH